MKKALTRRDFLRDSAAVSSLLAIRPALGPGTRAMEVHVAPHGDDRNPGTSSLPLRTPAYALQLTATAGSLPRRVLLHAGTYELAEPLRITARHGGGLQAPLHMSAYAGSEAVLSGGTRLSLTWSPYRDGIWQARVPAGTRTDQLFLNGHKQVLARFPNFDPAARYLNGTATAQAIAARSQGWAQPAGATLHGLQQSLWGSLQFRILDRAPDGSLQLVGGWQIDRNQPMHPDYRFVEGIFEELDAPGEWFLDESSSTLYVYPPPGLDLASATVEIVRLENLITITGTATHPVRGIHMSGLRFRCARHTFMQTREPLLRSDWRIYRGGALFSEGAEDVLIEDCFFDTWAGTPRS